MLKWASVGLGLALASGTWADTLSPSLAQRASMSGATIAATIVRMCLDQYHSHAPCACPYDVDRGGHSCGRRSAYDRPGGYSPVCFARDVTPGMIADFRAGKFVLTGC
jgi:hypothetical protein